MEPVWVVTGSYQKTGGSVSSDSVELEQRWSRLGDQVSEYLVDLSHFMVEPFHPSGQVADHQICPCR